MMTTDELVASLNEKETLKDKLRSKSYRLKRFFREVLDFHDHFWRLKRMWSMVRLYWGTPDYDWSTITYLMRHQIRRTREHIQGHNLFTGADRASRQMLITEELLRRLVDDVAFDMAEARQVHFGIYPRFGRAWGTTIESLHRQYEDLLFRQLRYLQSWWD